ncbi:unnamed protein product [Acanthoscelides obtectus]|uniref:Uncharacterized protein n=1 Tax=Acanthoscelides obtectus TaxID=200917 RepID=A0A9P0KSU0_ACAOB|nr:unnamed protein product [Acanthoscelides obtectus]CAK1685066.1 hypothetical protein AOBTE_LOCUS35217 [Acanthoscelides obtectus]
MLCSCSSFNQEQCRDSIYAFVRAICIGIEFSDEIGRGAGGDIATVHEKWLTPRKKRVWWPPYKQQGLFFLAPMLPKKMCEEDAIKTWLKLAPKSYKTKYSYIFFILSSRIQCHKVKGTIRKLLVSISQKTCLTCSTNT